MAISLSEFEKEFKKRLGTRWEVVQEIFLNFGPLWSGAIYLVFNTALAHGKVRRVITLLEEHWDNYLSKQPLKERACADNSIIGPTRQLFNRIYDLLCNGSANSGSNKLNVLSEGLS